MQRPWRGAAYWLAPHGFISQLSYSIQDHHPGDNTPTMSWALLHQLKVVSAGCTVLLVLLRVPFATVKPHVQEASWGGKGLFSFYFHIAVHH